MISEAHNLKVESERVYVVYDVKTGVIAHVHRVITHTGATQLSDEQGETHALEMARRFGQRSERLRVLRAEKFNGGVPQRVDVRTGLLVPEKPAKVQRPATREARKSPKVPASRRKKR